MENITKANFNVQHLTQHCTLKVSPFTEHIKNIYFTNNNCLNKTLKRYLENNKKNNAFKKIMKVNKVKKKITFYFDSII